MPHSLTARLGQVATAVLVATAACAQSATPVAIDIAAQPLDKALGALARQSGVRIVFSTDLAETRNGQALTGTLTVQQALDRLLAGSGLVARPLGGGGYTVGPAGSPPADSAALPKVTVTASHLAETATSSVAGYFARRTASVTKTDTPIIEVPQSVSVVTRQQIDDQRPASLTEALEYAPGVFTGQVGATNRYDYVPLRGFIETSTDNTVLDGLKILSDGGSYSSMQVEPYLVERIDVYRGPSSVLFGRNAPGGLVAMTSKRPTPEPYRQVEVTLGSQQRRQAGFDVAGPVAEAGGAWSYRLTGMGRDGETLVDHVRESRYAVAPSLQYEPDGRTRLLLQAYWQNDPEGGYHGGLPAEVTVTTARTGQRVPRSFFEGDPDYNAFKRKQRMVGYQFEHTFDNQWTVRQNFRYLESSVHLEQVYAYGWAGPTTLNRYVSGADESLRGWTVDNQAQREFSTGAARHTLLAGVDYQHRNVTGAWYSGSATPIDVLAPVYGNPVVGSLYTAQVDRRLVQTGLYAQDQVAWDRWRFTVGGRQDWSRTDSLKYGATDDYLRWSGNKFSARAGAVYLFDSGFAPYASYSESFNPSGFTDTAGQVLEPTESRQVEVGLKYEPAGGYGMASVALYDLVQDHVATRVLGTPNYEPVGKVRSRGLEAEARLQLGRNLALLGSYTLTDAEYVRAADGQQGKTPYQVPRQMASVWTDYTVLAGVSVGAGVRHVGSSWADNDNTLKVPAYTLADLAVRIDLALFGRDWRGANLRFNVKNVADKTYVASCASLGYCYYGDARRVSATLDYQW
ncbi:TonB-dependent siderophore receptor [Rhizobacter sp. Root1221]|uniref:TonB-dependent siderophore receptor n=1 Tax=Rhizobacter sp. Root1221 TaxID=1736433 RepID=UPI0006FB3CB6|nr:TonB-dependent siderophore receptor [Rhizobacter sp. Root1221]KQV94460.1 ferrioxamine B receptor [Rhizobacter sp. Root1221]